VVNSIIENPMHKIQDAIVSGWESMKDISIIDISYEAQYALHMGTLVL
jgi:hypothetical protein